LHDIKRKEKKHASIVDFEELPRRPKNENPGNKYLFYFTALIGFVTDSEYLWLVDSGPSRHMTRDRYNLTSVL